MDEKRFDDLTRRLRTTTSRRTGIRALVGSILGMGTATAASDTLARKRKKRTETPSECNGDRRCGDDCCLPGFDCIFGRCQRQQNWGSCTAIGESCTPGSSECCDDQWGRKMKCPSGTCVNDGKNDSESCRWDWQCVSGWCACDNLICSPNYFPYHTTHDKCLPRRNNCRVFQESCSRNDDCCNKNCRHGLCADIDCKANGEPCADDRFCCSFNCAPTDGGDHRCAA